MVDIHTHITPNIDDGADSLSEALRIIHSLKHSGTESVILTPHYPNRVFGENKPKQKYISEIKHFISLPEVINTGINFYVGAEVYGGSGIFKLIEDNEIITLNNTKYVLVEFPVNQGFSFLLQVVEALINTSYIPVIAHTERYACIQENPSFAKKLVDMGCVIQINAESILSSCHRYEFELADWLLRHRLANIIASDTHGLYERAPDLSIAHSKVCLRYSLDYAETLFYTNPNLIINNQNILRGKE